ncbi:MAG: ribonuclease PH [Thermoplasmatota archaeon]
MAEENRNNDEIRKTEIVPNYLENPLGSVLISSGNTKVICTAMLEESAPPWIENNDDLEQGWLTARYGMLPGSGESRIRRERHGARGRTKEIQRLIGRCLRASLDLKKLGERTIWIDCDVIQADGGTRTASITGAWVALNIAIKRLLKDEKLDEDPIIRQIAAISTGIVDDEALLDLKYTEDFGADVDMNVVMDSEGNYIEIQASGEEAVFTREQHEKMLDLAKKGVEELFEIQNEALKKA